MKQDNNRHTNFLSFITIVTIGVIVVGYAALAYPQQLSPAGQFSTVGSPSGNAYSCPPIPSPACTEASGSKYSCAFSANGDGQEYGHLSHSAEWEFQEEEIARIRGIAEKEAIDDCNRDRAMVQYEVDSAFSSYKASCNNVKDVGGTSLCSYTETWTDNTACSVVGDCEVSKEPFWPRYYKFTVTCTAVGSYGRSGACDPTGSDMY